MRRNRLVVVVAVVLVAASIATYDVYQASQPRWGGIDYASAPSTFHSPVRNGLELTATIKELFLPEGQNLTVVEEVNDTLSAPLTVNATSMVNPAYGPCQQGFAAGIEVYAGNLTYMELFNNGSSPKPLQLYKPPADDGMPCRVLLVPSPQSSSMLPPLLPSSLVIGRTWITMRVRWKCRHTGYRLERWTT